MGTVGAAMCWRHRVAFLFDFASAVGSRDGSRNPRMSATCAPSREERREKREESEKREENRNQAKGCQRS
jgi:hypothetical protein